MRRASGQGAESPTFFGAWFRRGVATNSWRRVANHPKVCIVVGSKQIKAAPFVGSRTLAAPELKLDRDSDKEDSGAEGAALAATLVRPGSLIQT